MGPKQTDPGRHRPGAQLIPIGDKMLYNSAMQPFYFDSRTASAPPVSFKRGQQVRLHEGALVQSSHPRRKVLVNQRDRVVRIQHVDAATFVSVREALNEYHDQLVSQGHNLSLFRSWSDSNAPEFHHVRVELNKPRLVWAGVGGYWCQCDIDAVSPIEQAEVARHEVAA
jgi:hypothetical protein